MNLISTIILQQRNNKCLQFFFVKPHFLVYYFYKFICKSLRNKMQFFDLINNATNCIPKVGFNEHEYSVALGKVKLKMMSKYK